MQCGFRIFLEIIVCSPSNLHYLIDSSMAFFPAVLHVLVKTLAAVVFPIKLRLIVQHAPCNCVHSAMARVCLGDMNNSIAVVPVKTISAEFIHLVNEWYQTKGLQEHAIYSFFEGQFIDHYFQWPHTVL